MNYDYILKYFTKKWAPNTWHLDDSVFHHCDLTFILSGNATYHSDNETFSLSAGEAVFLPAGSSRYAHTTGMQCVAFNFDSSEFLFPCATKIIWNNDPILNTYFEDFNQCWNAKSDVNKIRCDGLFLLIISRLIELQQLKQRNPYIIQIENFLRKHYTEKITVQTVAAQVQLSSVYCGALFSKETGTTILHYVNNLRITKAKELLNYTNDSISEIAAEIGFEDIYYFSRIFKKYTGLSPYQYRAKRV